MVVGELHTLLTTIIDIGKAHQLGCNFSGRIKPFVFRLTKHSWHFKFEYLLRLLGCHLTCQIHKLFVGITSQSLLQLLPGNRQQTGQLGELGRLVIHQLWIGPECYNRCTDSERLAATIGNDAPIGRNRFGPDCARLPLYLQKLITAIDVRQHLQAGDMPETCHRQNRQHHHHQHVTPALNGELVGPDATHSTFSPARTTITSPGFGTRICNSDLASCSTRLSEAQELCSSK